MVKRALTAVTSLTLACCLSSLNALACSAPSSTTGVASGGGQAGPPFGPIGSDAVLHIAFGGFILLAAGVLAIALVVSSRPRRPVPTLMAQLSPDGRYWWDGMAWHDGVVDPLPTSVRSADGAHWWDGGRWRPIPAS
jgi:hypothetical protein